MLILLLTIASSFHKICAFLSFDKCQLTRAIRESKASLFSCRVDPPSASASHLQIQIFKRFIEYHLARNICIQRSTIHKTSQKKKNPSSHLSRTADGAINEITLVTKCKRQIILRIAISISPSHISKAEKREITPNTPYFEAKR